MEDKDDRGPQASYRETKAGEPSGSKEVSNENKPVKPRRERRTEVDVEKNTNAPLNSESIPSEGDKPRRKRQTAGLTENDNNGGGWMISGPDQPVSNQSVEEDTQKEVANPNNKDKFFQETNDEIVMIPDLDEDGYDIDERVARAPRNVNRIIPSMDELEAEVKAAIPSDEGGLDLGVLLRTLMPASQVLEPDALWTFESLLRDVTEELTAPPATIISPMSVGLSPNKLNAGTVIDPNPDSSRSAGKGSVAGIRGGGKGSGVGGGSGNGGRQ